MVDNISQKQNKSSFVAELNYILFGLICLCPFVDYYCPWYITAIPVIIIILSLLPVVDLANDLVVPFLLIVCLVCIRYFAKNREAAFILILVNGTVFFLSAILSICLIIYGNKRFIKFFAHFILLIIMITCITTLIGYEMYPSASREFATGNTQLYSLDLYSKKNIGGYDFIYGLTMLVPFAVFLFTKETKKYLKIFDAVCIVVYSYTVYCSQFTIALLILLTSFFLVILFKNKKVAIGLIVVLLLLVLTSGFGGLAKILSLLADNDKSEYVSDKLSILSGIFSGNKDVNNVDNRRIKLYLRAINSFISNPIFGKNLFSYSKQNVSGHSVILDLLASFGVLGFSVYFIMFKKLLQSITRKSLKNKYYYMLVLNLILVALLNNVDFMTTYFVLFFSTAIMYSYENQQ